MLAIVQDVYHQLQDARWKFEVDLLSKVCWKCNDLLCALPACFVVLFVARMIITNRLQPATFIHNVLEVLDDKDQYGYGV